MTPASRDLRPTTKDLTGLVFGHLVVEAFAGYSDGHATWQCRCVCGGSKLIWSSDLRSGKRRSCGCGHFGSSAVAAPMTATESGHLARREEAARAKFWRERETKRGGRSQEFEIPIPWMA